VNLATRYVEPNTPIVLPNRSSPSPTGGCTGRSDNHLRIADVAAYTVAQTIGGIGGAVLANLMFSLAPVTFSDTERCTPNLWLGEVVATAGLILLIFALVRTGRAALAAAPAVGAYIGAAYWFTTSTSFANPAVTVGRAFTNTFAGIAPISVPGFVVAQLAGAVLAALVVTALYPRPVAVTADTTAVEPAAADTRTPAGSPR
jgi:glycerol uptake facilitator-like aquaporin